MIEIIFGLILFIGVFGTVFCGVMAIYWGYRVEVTRAKIREIDREIARLKKEGK
jgi:hypothetical protein